MASQPAEVPPRIIPPPRVEGRAPSRPCSVRNNCGLELVAHTSRSLGLVMQYLDMPAQRPTLLGRADPEYADRLMRHKLFLGWLAKDHYGDDAEAWKKLKSANIAAINLGELARDVANFKP